MKPHKDGYNKYATFTLNILKDADKSQTNNFSVIKPDS